MMHHVHITYVWFQVCMWLVQQMNTIHIYTCVWVNQPTSNLQVSPCMKLCQTIWWTNVSMHVFFFQVARVYTPRKYLNKLPSFHTHLNQNIAAELTITYGYPLLTTTNCYSTWLWMQPRWAFPTNQALHPENGLSWFISSGQLATGMTVLTWSFGHIPTSSKIDMMADFGSFLVLYRSLVLKYNMYHYVLYIL